MLLIITSTRYRALGTYLPMKDLRSLSPPMRIAQTITVTTPIGAVPRRMPSAHHMDVERNCFVVSSPNRTNRGARSVKRLLAKFAESTGSTVRLRWMLTL